MAVEFLNLLLDVWREVGRHIEIDQSVERVAPLLMQRLPVDLVLVRRLDIKRSCVETVAAGSCSAERAPERIRSELHTDELERLLTWLSEGSLLYCSSREAAARLPGLLPTSLTGEILAGPLHSTEGGASGVLILVARPPHHFGERDSSMFQALLEPFTVAFENDRRVRELVSLREAVEAENRSLLSRLGRSEGNEIVGARTGLRGALERVNQVAASDVPVLISGETGSGKEVVARAIHEGSPRAAGPFLRVNCGAIPPELIDSELFGHERGSFTGAANLRKGWFERADGGSLFLDECGELPLAAQVRLLRILQDGSFERVGGEKQINVDVRIIAATHRDLKGMVADGQFRQDLWYRIAVFPIHLPPLRERLEDIAEMAAHFALRAAKRFGMPPLVPTPEDVQLLVSYPWPGNVRELRAVLERAAILGDGKRLEVAKALGSDPAIVTARPSISAQVPLREPPGQVATLDVAMARHIETALSAANGRIEGPGGAASLLGINPHTLRARMRKLRIDWSRFRHHRTA